jgi:hypothetical protein
LVPPAGRLARAALCLRMRAWDRRVNGIRPCAINRPKAALEPQPSYSPRSGRLHPGGGQCARGQPRAYWRYSRSPARRPGPAIKTPAFVGPRHSLGGDFASRLFDDSPMEGAGFCRSLPRAGRPSGSVKLKRGVECNSTPRPRERLGPQGDNRAKPRSFTRTRNRASPLHRIAASSRHFRRDSTPS